MSQPESLEQTAQEQLRSACGELERRLRVGEQVDAAQVLLLYPELATHPELAVELIYTEFVLRQELGQHPSADQFYARYPQWLDELRQVFEVDGLFDTASRPTLLGNPGTLPSAHGPHVSARLAGKQFIGSYEVLDELGRGGMGVVYKARQHGLDRIVALKMLLAGQHADAEQLARFRAEARAAAVLQHPNIVQIFEVAEDDGHSYFSLEYVSGGSLQQRLKEGPLPPQAAAALMETLARAIHFAHQHGIVHRDLKPANVLLAGERAAAIDQCTAKIADFGLAKHFLVDLTDESARRTLSGVVLGTPGYMAPEQAAGESRSVGPAADVYALGAILYELLTGQPPFRGIDLVETLEQVRSREPVPPSRLQSKTPRELETICLKCLEKTPARRYASAEELADDLQRFLNEEPILARPASLAYRLRKYVRRKRWLMAGSLTVVLLVGLVIAMLVVNAIQQGRADIEARKLAEQTKQRKADGHYADGRMAAQRGQWRDALKHFDQALSAGHVDEVPLRLDRVKAWNAINDYSAASAEVAALAQRKDLGEYEGAVLLWQGDLLLNRDPDQALEFVRQALSKDLRPAERAYAEALLADSSVKAIEMLQIAIAKDPSHQPANVMLGTMLLILGRRDEARLQITAAERLFPDDQTFPLQRATLAALNDDMSQASAILKAQHDRLGDEQAAAFESLLSLLNLLCHLDESDSPAFQLKALHAQFVLIPSIKQSFQLSQTTASPSGVHALAPPPTLSAKIAELPVLITEALKYGNKELAEADNDKVDHLLQRLAQTASAHPDGLLYYLLGGLHVKRAESQDEHWEQAEQAFRTAAKSSSVARIQRPSLLMATKIEGFLALGGWPRKHPEMRQLFRDNLRNLSDEPLMPDDASYLAGATEKLAETDLARQVLADWERNHPRDVKALIARAEFELRHNAPGPAAAAAERALLLRPDDPQAKKILSQIQDR